MRYLLLLILLTSCLTPRNATRRQADLAVRFPAVLADAAARYLPVKPPVFIKGETVTKRDTTYLPGDSVECPPPRIDSFPFKVKCPDRLVIHDTLQRVDTIEVDSYAYERASLTEKLRAAENLNQVDAERISDLRKDRNWWKWACIITWILVAAYIGIKIAKPKLI